MRLSWREELSGYDRQVWLLALGSVINWMGLTIVSPFISIYLYHYLGVPMSDVGLAFLLSTTINGVGLLISGSLCDRFGRKAVMITGVLLEILCIGSLGAAIWQGFGFTAIMLLWAGEGLALGLYRNVPQVMVADVVPAGRQSGAYSILRVGGNLGFAIGPVIGGFIAAFSYPLMFLATAAFSLIYLLMVIFQLRDTKPSAAEASRETGPRASIWTDRAFLLFCAVGFVISLAASQLTTTLSAYASGYAGLRESSIGLLFSINALMVVVLQYPAARLLDRFRLTTALALGAALYGIGYVCIGFSTAFAPLAVAVVLITLGELASSPASMTFVAQLAPPGSRGRYISLSNFLGGAGFAFGPYVGGRLMDAYSGEIKFAWLIIAFIVLTGVAGAALLRYLVRDARDRPQISAPLPAVKAS